MPADLLNNIAERISLQPYKTLSEADAEELANRFKYGSEELQRTSAVLLLLKQRLIDTNSPPLEAVVQGRNLLGEDGLAKDTESEFVNVLSYSHEEREESLAIKAFAGGPAFLDLGILPSLLPATSSGTEFTAAYLWTISYLNAEGEQRSITIGLSPGELEQVETAIERGKEQLEAMRRTLDTTRTTKGQE